MELWGWLVGYLVLFALLHVVLYYVYTRSGSREDEATPRLHPAARSDQGTGWPAETDESPSRADLEEDTMPCPRCGATNASDPSYTYCWHCIMPLDRAPSAG